MSDVLRVDRLHKDYGSFTAVEDVSFEVAQGEIFGILGPNGAGKTTTVECIQGLRRIDGGSVSLLGLDPTHHAAQIRRRIGSQLQESALPDRMKVWEALELFSSLSPDGPSWEAVMSDWGLAEKRNAAFASLSGGQQQRLFVALALVNDPEVVFLDEMTTGLDPQSRRVAWDLIRRIRERGTTVILVTHFMDEAESLCDRLIVIDRKTIVALGTPQQLIDELGGGVRVRFTAAGPDLPWLAGLPNVTKVERVRDRWEVYGAGPVLAYVAAALVDHGIVPSDLRVERATLEDVFLAITQEGDGPT